MGGGSAYPYLGQSQTYEDPSLNEIEVNLNFTSTFFVEKTLYFGKRKNLKIVFAYISGYCASFGTKNLIWLLLNGRRGRKKYAYLLFLFSLFYIYIYIYKFVCILEEYMFTFIYKYIYI